MQSIFHDDNLLEALLKIGQAAPVNIDQLKNTALQLIGNLREEVSPVKANSNPTFTNLRSLKAFSEWLKSSGATYAGRPIVDGVEHDGPDAEGLQAILLDLRKKAAGTTGLYNEAIAGLITELNKSFGTKLDAYEPTEKKPEEIKDPTEPSKTQNNTMVNVKVDQSAVDNVNDKDKPQGAAGGANGQGSLVELSKSGGLSLLDGLTIDFDDLYLRANQISNYISKAEPKVAATLGQTVRKIGNIKHNFDILTAKTPGINTIGAAPSDGAIEIGDLIKSTFNAGIVPNEADKTNSPTAYRYDELAKIAIAFSGLMVEVNNFYYIVQRIPAFAQLPEIQKQMEWARLYKTSFMEAAAQFSGQHQSATQL